MIKQRLEKNISATDYGRESGIWSALICVSLSIPNRISKRASADF